MTTEHSYTIRFHDHGMSVEAPGGLAIEDLEDLNALAERRGFDLLDPGIGASLGPKVWVFTNTEHGDLWRKEIDRGLADLDPVESWLRGTGVGTSSVTIVCALTGRRHWQYRATDRGNVPHDPSDFGRCYRMLEKFPDLRAQLPEVAVLMPWWGPFVDRWDRMTAMYEAVLESGAKKAPELYEMLKKCDREAWEVE